MGERVKLTDERGDLLPLVAFCLVGSFLLVVWAAMWTGFTCQQYHDYKLTSPGYCKAFPAALSQGEGR